jgi:heme exporter protein A
MTRLSVTDLACARGGVPVLRGVSFALSAGQALILRGPNGSGKTTLLRTLAGLQPPLSGRIAAEPDSLAYAAHADGLKPALTAEENLAFWAAVHGNRAGPAAALAAFGIGALASRRAGDLSAGQKRRLALARLLVTARPVWLLDEPTVSLDAEAVALFADVVGDHLARGGAAVIATHIALGLDGAPVLDLAPHRAAPEAAPAFGDDW